jgi:large subunit ribosomal protein L4
MIVNVVDTKGKKVEELTLSDEVFGVELNKEVLAQYLRVFHNNQRQGTSSTKTRGDVSGGGIKPWRQKGTGRARVGSSRVPVWRHGGIAHGPQPRDWSLSLPKKIKRLAIVSALSEAARKNKMTVLSSLEFDTPKTKEMSETLKNLGLNGRILLVLNEADQKIIKSARNIKDVETTIAGTLNAYDLMRARNIIFLKDAVLNIENKYKG